MTDSAPHEWGWLFPAEIAAGSSPDRPACLDLQAGSAPPGSLVAMAFDGQRWRVAHTFTNNRRGRRAAKRIPR